MKKLLQVILIITSVILFSCSKNSDIQELDNQYPRSINQNIAALKISPDIVNLSIFDAENVAILSNFYNQSPTKSFAAKEVENVVPIISKDGNPVAYAINYRNGNGYTIVSATKNYYPILASVDMGKFNSDIEKMGVSVLIEKYKEDIRFWNTAPQDSIAKMRELWKVYEQQRSVVFPITKSNNDTRGDQIQTWMASGAVVYTLEDAAMVLPSEIYQQFYNMAASECNPEYDFLSNSVIIETSIETEYNNLISTLWAQGAPYNYSCRMIYYSRALVGCAAVAAAQIMKYHQWPSNKNWSSMPNSLVASSATTLSDFLNEVGENINTDYGLNQSTASSSSVNTALISTYNYLTGGLTSYNEAILRTSLANNRPVYLRGQEENEETGHAWVCDGYVYVTPSKHYQLYVTSYDEPLYFANTYCEYDSYTSSNYYLYHMNWGWGGLHNGWFMNKMFPTNYEYSKDMMMIANIRPHK